jgi:hypothetical protein
VWCLAGLHFTGSGVPEPRRRLCLPPPWRKPLRSTLDLLRILTGSWLWLDRVTRRVPAGPDQSTARITRLTA